MKPRSNKQPKKPWFIEVVASMFVILVILLGVLGFFYPEIFRP